MTTLSEINAQIAELQSQRESIRKETAVAIFAAMEKAASDAGLTVDEVLSIARPKTTRGRTKGKSDKSAWKVDPEDHSNVYKGGAKNKWLKEKYGGDTDKLIPYSEAFPNE